MSSRYTLTVDGSFDSHTGFVGIGIVVQVSDKPRKRGAVLSQLWETYVGIPPGMSEELAILRALEIASAYGADWVKVRSDYNYLRRSIKESHVNSLMSDSNTVLRSAILALAKTFGTVKFAYVQRRKNGVAHNLSRIGAKSSSPQKREDLFHY